MPRISGGQLKGRRIVSRKIFSTRSGGDELRPTSAKVREAVFDILQNEIQDSTFLDLYAGTGVMGLEALSRGAGMVVLVESDPVRAEAISLYVREIKISERAKVYRQKVEHFLKRASASGATFDIIFADPPYASDEIPKICELIGHSEVLKDSGCLVIEHSSREVLPERVQYLEQTKKYKYGDTMLTLYRKGR